MKHRLGKFGTVFLALALCLAFTGAGFALWSETQTISGTVNTGEVDWELTACGVLDEIASPPYYVGVPSLDDYTCREGFVGPPPYFWHSDKNVGWGEQELVDTDHDGDFDTLQLTLHNVYPCYFNSVSAYARNDGTVPIIIEKVIIDGTEITSLPAPVVRLDLNSDGFDDVEIWWGNAIGTQLEPGEDSPEMSFWFHCLQGAPQGATLTFNITLEAVQWNESIHP